MLIKFISSSLFTLLTLMHIRSIQGFIDNNYQPATLLCRSCGHTVVPSASAIIRRKSALALKSYNMTIIGVPTMVQVVENAVPEQFHIITCKNAELDLAGKAYSQNTWFPGYSWTATICPKCSSHLGWYFTADQPMQTSGETIADTFVGLVLDYLISDHYSNSLTKVPH